MKEETNKKGRANSVTIFHADAPQLSANPSWCYMVRAKLLGFALARKKSDWQRINKRQEHKAEAADTGTAIARIC